LCEVGFLRSSIQLKLSWREANVTVLHFLRYINFNFQVKFAHRVGCGRCKHESSIWLSMAVPLLPFPSIVRLFEGIIQTMLNFQINRRIFLMFEPIREDCRAFIGNNVRFYTFRTWNAIFLQEMNVILNDYLLLVYFSNVKSRSGKKYFILKDIFGVQRLC
jgi:hypothetical protein